VTYTADGFEITVIDNTTSFNGGYFTLTYNADLNFTTGQVAVCQTGESKNQW